jgi:hypothetical protein
VTKYNCRVPEKTVEDRIQAWGVSRRVAERPMREVVQLTAMSENKLNWLLQKHRGTR